jgi:hypothetical protein
VETVGLSESLARTEDAVMSILVHIRTIRCDHFHVYGPVIGVNADVQLLSTDICLQPGTETGPR